MQNDSFLQLNGVTKRYDAHIAVNQVSLSIPKAKIYGLLGPNGAGKTSIIRMITGITAPDAGDILFDGKPLIARHKQEIGYLPEERGLYKKMKVKEQIAYLLSLKGLPPNKARKLAENWLQRLGLAEWAGHKTTDLSKGMQQKVQFISTVAHEPKLLILDEPFSGLDPVNAKIIEQEILRLKEAGTTIIFSTHRMEQVEELCDRIALMNKGKLMIEDEINTVRERFQRNLYRLEYKGSKEALEALAGEYLEEHGEESAMLKLPEQDPKAMLRKLIESDLEIKHFSLYLPRLNDIFIELVGNA